MKEQDVFILADQALLGVVEQITDEQWEMAMPASFLRRDQSAVTLREIINYHAYDDAWVPDMLAGLTMEEAGKEKFDGDLLDGDPLDRFREIAERAMAAAAACDDLDRMVHCSFGDYPAREYFWQINAFRGLRAHDIAEAIGAPSILPDELIAGLWEEIEPHADEWRAYGVFPAKVEVAADAPLMDKLLGITGRQP